jgi:Ca2+-binding EF-hand superfamily protein
VDEAEAALLDMFRKADTDGDGSISYNEFALAEAWWMNSTLNPTKVSLF